MQDMKIVELMSVPAAGHDLDWLKESLQAAIKLEFATLPPYLAAYWSVKDRLNPVARSIRDIFREEMLHYGIACNLLSGIGGQPILNTPEAVPIYPGPLPGGVSQELEIALQGLSKDAAALFMKIEFPEDGPIAFAADFHTIGEFYTAIQTAFDNLQPPFTLEKQIEGPLGLSKIHSLDEARQAIQLIKRQGEGSKASPEDTGPLDLAHYYRFGEIFHEQRLKKDSTTGEWHFNGDALRFPDVWPMGEVPPGGYRKDQVTDQVWQLLEQFDEGFTNMLDQLQNAWQTGDDNPLSEAVGSMLSLRAPAVALMGIPRSTGAGSYGPCFRLIPKS
jgi:hypothetical protein